MGRVTEPVERFTVSEAYRTLAKAAQAEPPVPEPAPGKLIVGAEAYPDPPEVSTRLVTAPFATSNVPAAPVPEPPVNPSAYPVPLVYPEPPETSVSSGDTVSPSPVSQAMVPVN